MATYLVDTNVLLRLVDYNSPQHAVSIAAIRQLISRKDIPLISAQNIVEFWAVATRPIVNNGLGYDKARASTELEKLKRMFVLAPDSPRILEEWLLLVRQNTVLGKRTHDARLAACVRAHAIDHLLTFNEEDFRTLGVSVIGPGALIPTSPS
jgi:predicted nucleic acid-binding protein